jgi:carboxypeptidase Taq
VEQANLREMTRHYQQARCCRNRWWKPNRWRAASVNTPGVRSVRQMTGRVFRKPERGGQTQPRRGPPACRGKGCSPYDALLDIFEPDMTSARLDVLFAT